jgi:adenylate cyclase
VLASNPPPPFLWTGLLTTILAACAVADPMRTVRLALQQVQRGDLSASVPVYGATELGQLQAGFNTMAAGLRERERISDLFGRHVGRDVARAATATATGEVQLGGEVRTVSILFVDLSAAPRSPLNAPRPRSSRS